MAKPASSFAPQPSQLEMQPVLSLFNAGKLAEAETAAKKLVARYPNTFILYQILGISQDGLSKFNEAAENYSKALTIQPNTPDLHFNLGITLTNLNRYEEAEASYRKAIALQAGFFEAHGNLGTVLQKQGRLEEAVTSYRKALSIHEDPRGHFNLGTALRDKGKLDEAITHFKQAIKMFPNYADAHNYLGECYRDQGNMEDAIKCYFDTLALNQNHAGANYNMGEFLYLAGRYDEAVDYLERSKLDDWQERALYCTYKAEHFDSFKIKLDHIVNGNEKHTAPFLQTLSTHHAVNFGTEDQYNFCKNGFDFVYQKSIAELAEPDSQLLKDLLNDINNTAIEVRAQGMIINGKQSAGNLFKRPEASFRKLGEIVKQEFLNYKNQFAGADCELIKSFPKELEFTSSWYVRLRSGGYLERHIHEVGWISGAVYLVLPKDKKDLTEGCFEYGLHGDNYPQKHNNFPVGIASPSVGDIVLFPSSLFHRTIPFTSNEERICIAFDLKPEGHIFIKSSY
ncbi:tetratricopeptide repeat protein [Methylotenera versatilis]|uniref:TPR repeat-containing protein n=1 Tax=Methylotenera versatilis (strain 301) TaxID=666681 RepID=D7DMQ1_METV0|nr:2OG-Fe(II) oxygenase family protein [Methylotenera versatilis]ADI30828.1 TPR repeat-containing protein [Methylotenera versatilis 301]